MIVDMMEDMSGSYSGSSSNNAPSSVFEKIIWFVIFSVFSIAIVRKIYNIMMEQKREWLRFMKTKIILPAKYDIEETKQFYLRTRWSIVFKQKATQYDSEVLKVIIKNPVKQSSTHEIQLNGKDNFGSWSATGFISFDDRILIQFKKIYDNREKAGQIGNWRDLYYEGEMVFGFIKDMNKILSTVEPLLQSQLIDYMKKIDIFHKKIIEYFRIKLSYNIYIICIVLSLASLVLSQGGGGSKSRSSSSSRRSSSRHYSHNIDSTIDDLTFFGVMYSGFELLKILGICGTILVIVAIIYSGYEKRKQWTRFMNNRKVMPANYDIQETKQLYLKTKWSIIFMKESEITQYESEVFKTEIKNPDKKSARHDLELKGKDQFGSWSASGFISFDDPIRIQFKKVYDDREKAGQTGKWRDLYYEGEMESQHLIKGNWFYKGFENDPIYSGTFTLQLVD
ncbi:hypothetical protein pb186bvf_012053 [Paramecium bursaria]